ncbi:sigma-70 family RNA polymerase sigma factor [Demequina gelatinilytica]|uniref:sigma-70 family RNA polymerase sigma factor n=1 Tax=Demequina gelatinilytica TaxID=1638980 RepID=UPI0007859342|nr:sigma-70 family RNA polymerase sigma factor [Demequina gelatinilytica]
MGRWGRALDGTMREHGEAIFAHARALAGDDAAATALVEEALVETFSHGHVPESPTAGMRAVMRTMRRAAVRATAPPVPPAPPEGRADASSLAREALTTLPRRERALTVLRYGEGLAVEAIAEEAGLKERDVREGLTRAVRLLLSAYPGIGLTVEDALEGGMLETASVEEAW